MSLDLSNIPQELKPLPQLVVSPPLIFSWRTPKTRITPTPAVNYPDLLSAGTAMLKGGVSVFPVNNRKRPTGKWKAYQGQRATIAELENWCKKKSVHGLAMICGEISKGLVIKDFDVPGFFERCIEAVKRNREVRELAYILPIQQTGSGNHQMAFRCGLSLRNDKLAWVPADNTQGRETAIETRAEAGYAVVSPSHCPEAEKHGVKHKQAYRVIQGDFARIPTITDRQATILLDIARSLDEMPLTTKEMKKAPLSPRSNGGSEGGGVIGAFNEFYKIEAILSRNGYQPRGNRYLAPDSTSGLPGVYVFEDTGRCYSHHANDSLNDGYSHNAFSAFCILEHANDLKAAVKAAALELGIERTHIRIQQPAAADETTYDQAERAAIQEEAQELPPDWRGPQTQTGQEPIEGEPKAAPPKASIEDLICDVSTFNFIEFPEKRNILDPWLSEATINMGYGPRGVGKTMFAFGILCAATTGEPFGNWQVNTPVPSLYLDGEMAPQDTQKRLSRFPSLKNKEREPLIIYSDAQMNLHGLPRANLLDDDWRKMMKQLLLGNGIKLWVADNIASLAPGIDENSKQEWDPVNQWFLELRFAGITTIFLHHANKDGGQRGTSGREDNIDISILLDWPKGYTGGDGCQFVTKFKKARLEHKYLHLITDTEFNLETDTDENYFWTHRNLKVQNRKTILELLDQEMTQKDIAESLGIDKGYVSRVKTQAVKDGYLGTNGKLTQSGFVFVYSALN